MDSGLIARRYATVLHDYAVDEGRLEAVYQDSLTVREALAQTPEALKFLCSPLRKPSEKKGLLKAVFAANVCPQTARFLDFLVDKERVGLVAEVMRVFETIYRAEKHIVTAQVTTAVELPEAQKNDIKSLITERLRAAGETVAEVVAAFRADERIIGGVVLALDGRQLDDSVATKLKAIKRQLTV